MFTPVRTRSLLSLPPIARYSTQTLWGPVSAFIRQQDHQSPATQMTQQQHGRPVKKWRNFELYRVVKPRDFTYEGRLPSHRPSRPSRSPPGSAMARYNDVFYQLDIDPLSQATNPALLGEFVTEMGMIRNRASTGLTTKTQRKLGKAIRRARMMGVIPILSKPPQSLSTI